MATQTLFEIWCKEKGFDPEGVFTVTAKGSIFDVGTKLDKQFDDESDNIYFVKSFATGRYGSVRFRHQLTQLQEDNTMNSPVNATAVNTTTQTFPQTPFKLSCGDRPEVRKWLKDNGCKWRGGKDLTNFFTTKEFLYVSNQQTVSYNTRKDRYTDKELPELTLSFSDPIPAAVCSWEFVKEEEEVTTQAPSPSRKRKKLKKAIKKLQKELTKLEQEEA